MDGPTTPPLGAVRINPGQDLSEATTANPAGTTFWLAPGVHTLAPSPYGQVIAQSGNTYIGAPGAIFDGQKVNRYAFTQTATNVTIKHLTIRNFVAPGDEAVVNGNRGAGWVTERNTIHLNGGAGVYLGNNNRLTYNCLADNSQYGFQGDGNTVVVDHNEVARNNTFDYETNQPGCGCSGGAKFWGAENVTITNNWVHDNYYVGLWADNNNVGFLIEGNYIEGNRSAGIMYETSYNVRIANNTLKRNSIPHGQEYQSRGDPFPIGAIYLSEAHGDSRANGAIPPGGNHFSSVEVSGNVFEDNWAGVVGWENADRFGSDGSANTSKGYTTLLVDPFPAWPSQELWRCGNPATGGLIAAAPYFSDCRWKTQNLLISNNDFKLSSKPAIGCTSNLCSQQGLFANYGTVPSWSPYKGRIVQEAITFKQNNRWSNNRYSGDWTFAAYEAVGPTLSFDQWRAAPYNQDAGSVYNVGTTVTTTTLPTTATTTTSTTTTPTTTTPTTTTPTTTTPTTGSIWPDSLGLPESDNGLEYTLGTRFVVSSAGRVTALRFYETANMAGPISLKLWRATGATTGIELASATYMATAGQSGWRNVALVTPVAVAPTERYVTSYHTLRPFAQALGGLQNARVSGALTASADSDPVGYRDGLYKEEYGTHTFPTNGDGHSYFADVVLTTDR